MVRQLIDNRGITFRMHVVIPRTTDTTEKLHCIFLNLYTVKRKFWQHQDLELELRLFFSLSIVKFTKLYFRSDPSFEIKNNHD